jgi:hypothetical protein
MTPPASPPPRKVPITPAGIFAELEKLPPLQREEIAKNYVGINVDWDAEPYSAKRVQKEGSDTKLVDLCFRSTDDKLIWCDKVDISNYPEFKIMKTGTKVRVTGTISRIDPELVSSTLVSSFECHWETRNEGTFLI